MSDELNFQMLTPERFRWVLAIGESTEAEWRAQKRVAFFKVGRAIRYTPAAVLELIQGNTRRARGAGTSNIQHPTSNIEEWGRIERLIADQVRAQVRAARATAAEHGTRSAELKQAA
jgi:hypothetical protein